VGKLREIGGNVCGVKKKEVPPREKKDYLPKENQEAPGSEVSEHARERSTASDRGGKKRT